MKIASSELHEQARTLYNRDPTVSTPLKRAVETWLEVMRDAALMLPKAPFAAVRRRSLSASTRPIGDQRHHRHARHRRDGDSARDAERRR